MGGHFFPVPSYRVYHTQMCGISHITEGDTSLYSGLKCALYSGSSEMKNVHIDGVISDHDSKLAFL